MFALISQTRGDELIAQKREVVMVSHDRAALEAERSRRATEREQYLAANPLPPWMLCSVIAGEEIEEVPELSRYSFPLQHPRAFGVLERPADAE